MTGTAQVIRANSRDLPLVDCPNKDRHTPAPDGYTAWHDWAARMHYSGARQSRCDGCGLYVIWRGGAA